MVGAHRIVDAGTTFEVSHDEHAIRVEVAEGMVIVDPAVEALRLAPGQAVELIEGRQTKRELVARESVGQWRRASLSYTDAPLTRVAADLSVALGHSIVVDAAARDRRITATITPATVKGKPDEAAELFGVRIVATSRGWIFYQR
ncbi:transmembrane sensor [Sphingomonas carotinifaciens]|nr:transmembrane sensor [Sphingomonas carotinifaciens]